MKLPLEIIQTGDGSSSLLNTVLNETYHSTHGALRESLHVFIEHGLQYFRQHFDQKAVHIFEVGFGTGLNAFLAAQFASTNNINIHYTSIEAFPLEKEIWSKLNYASGESESKLFARLHDVSWDIETALQENFTLLKKTGSLLQERLPTDSYDVIFFDAFAPSKQPEMWELGVLEKVIKSMKSPAVFATYCARGQLKRDLKTLGLKVETLPGPPGKKEMVRAIKAG